METIIAIKVSGGWMLITIGDWEGKMVVVTRHRCLPLRQWWRR